MRDQRRRGKRRAVAADANENIGEPRLGRLGEIDDLGHVCQVIAGKRDDIGTPALDRPAIGAMVLDLQVDQPDGVAGVADGLRHEFETERLKPQEYFGVKQRARMDPEKPHRILPTRQRRGTS
jgi:hypothetical protein